MATAMKRVEALQFQRQRQQGLGRPIISASLDDQRFVAVGNTFYYTPKAKWQTFHDFLIQFLQNKMGREWWEDELAKNELNRHPLMKWVFVAVEEKKRTEERIGGVTHGPMTGSAAAMFNLAYDLYALEHNVEVQGKLLKRLRNEENFFGARYEASVAATLIRAGFAIEFEDEDDRSTTHCEFTATFTATGKQFSVEAKRRHGKRYSLNKFLVNALSKAARFSRVVFIDANMADDGSEGKLPKRLDALFKKLPMMEGAVIEGRSLPAAYVFVTNSPWEHHLRSPIFQSLVMFDGFKIPQFSYRYAAHSLREAINARDQHKEMHALVKGMSLYGDIPSTFDGEIPEFAFGKDSVVRLLVGEVYELPSEVGKVVRGVLSDAVVIEQEKVAHCIYLLEDGSNAHYRCELSDAEILAWKRHPETFFGVVKEKYQAQTPLGLYDFFLAGYAKATRETLLKLMERASDIDALKALALEELRSIYAERTTLGALAAQAASSKA
jgi:hypothetical protein